MLEWLREKSAKRRKLLAQHCGLKDLDDLGPAFGYPRRRRKRTNDDQPGTSSDLIASQSGHQPLRTSSKAYQPSSHLKGPQNPNPHNDYCQHFVDTGQRPQNFIRDVGMADRFEEYPKLKELIRLKDELITQTAVPPMYLKSDLRTGGFKLQNLRGKFDVILVEPPLAEYQGDQVGGSSSGAGYWSWEEIMALPLEEISAQRSFVFLWVGSSDGLDLGRQCLRKWGFRRCEDICWIKTNLRNRRGHLTADPKAIFQRTKEHCLMGIKGTVRRSIDGDFIHANVDIDLIISEEPELGCQEKPEEMFHIIEHFCLGRRRLHLFGRDSTIRPGWLTIGPNLTNSNFNSDAYWSNFESPNGHLTGCTDRIEALRPKSPPPKGPKNGPPVSSVSSVGPITSGQQVGSTLLMTPVRGGRMGQLGRRNL